MRANELKVFEENKVIKMNNILVTQEARKNIIIQKLFLLIIANAKQLKDKNIIEISKAKMITRCEIKDYRTLRTNMNALMQNSLIHLEKENQKYIDVFLIPKIESTTRTYKITIAKELKPILIEYAKGYTELCFRDVMKFKSKQSIMLYQWLMYLHYESASGVELTTQQLYKIFDLKNTDYNYNTHFDRTNFEKKVLNKAINEIKTSQCISNLSVKKKKKTNSNEIQCYIFKYRYISPKDPIKNEIRNIQFEELQQLEEITKIADVKWTDQ